MTSNIQMLFGESTTFLRTSTTHKKLVRLAYARSTVHIGPKSPHRTQQHPRLASFPYWWLNLSQLDSLIKVQI